RTPSITASRSRIRPGGPGRSRVSSPLSGRTSGCTSSPATRATTRCRTCLRALAPKNAPKPRRSNGVPGRIEGFRECLMDRRCLTTLSWVLALAILAPLSVAGQGSGWTVPRTPWGHPDLMGTYTNKTFTPVQRPVELADREFLTKDEMVRLERERIERNRQLDDAPAERTEVGGITVRRAHERGDGSATGYYNNFWLDWGTKPTGRTSLIVDPPNGRIPPVTPEFERRVAQRREQILARADRKKDWTVTGNGLADSWMDFQLNDRCIVWSAGPPMMPGPYN